MMQWKIDAHKIKESENIKPIRESYTRPFVFCTRILPLSYRHGIRLVFQINIHMAANTGHTSNTSRYLYENSTSESQTQD